MPVSYEQIRKHFPTQDMRQHLIELVKEDVVVKVQRGDDIVYRLK